MSIHSIEERQAAPYTFQSYQERLIALEDLKELYLVLPKRKTTNHSMPSDSSPSHWPTMQDVLAAFVKHDIEFIIIGGYAVVFHGHVRLTRDIDLFIQPTRENVEKIVAAFTDLDFKNPDLNSDGLMKKGSVYKFGKAPNQIELLNEVKGITWEEAKNHIIAEKLFDQPVLFLDLDTLIKSKKAAGRLQGLADVEALEQIRCDSWLSDL